MILMNVFVWTCVQISRNSKIFDITVSMFAVMLATVLDYAFCRIFLATLLTIVNSNYLCYNIFTRDSIYTML